MKLLLASWLVLQGADGALERGIVALEAGRLEEAESLLRQAVELAPADATPRLLLGQVLIATHRPKLALEVLDPISGDGGAVACMRGRALFELEQYQDAVRELTAAVENLGDDRVCRESLALARIETGDSEGALAALGPFVSGTSAAERSPALNTTYGIALALDGRHEEAIASLEAALAAEPRRARALYSLGRSLQLLDRFEDAASVYQRGVDFPPPENIRFSLGLARCRIALGQMAGARRELDALVARHPRVGRGWLLRGVVAFEEGRYEDAVNDVRRAIEHGYTLAESDLRLGMALGMLGRYTEAQEALDAALEKEGDLAVAYYFKGLFLFRQGEELVVSSGQLNPFGVQSLRLLQRSNALLANPRTSLAMAEAYLRLGQHLRVVDAASEATSVPALAAEAYHLKALAHHELLEYEAAEENYQNAFAAGADSAEIHHDFGNLLSVMGRWDEARAALGDALARDDDYAGAHLQLGIALANLNRGDEALPHLERAARLMPVSAEAWYQKGLVESRQSNSDDAVSSWRKALQLDPEDSRLLYRLGTELLKLGRMEERNALLAEFQERQREAEVSEQRDERLENLLRAALKAADDGDAATALSLLTEARTLAPDDPRPYVYLADLHASRGQPREARRVLEEGLARLPDDLSLREMLRTVGSGSGSGR